MSKKENFWPFAGFILLSLLAGGLGALLSQKGMAQYQALPQPPLSPPGWAFPVVWSLLYILMGIGAALVFIAPERGFKEAHWIFGLQLLLNFLWPLLFFGLELRLAAFVDLLVLLILALSMAVKFKAVKPLAGYLQIPYILWLTFAGYLNLSAYLLNG